MYLVSFLEDFFLRLSLGVILALKEHYNWRENKIRTNVFALLVYKIEFI